MKGSHFSSPVNIRIPSPPTSPNISPPSSAPSSASGSRSNSPNTGSSPFLWRAVSSCSNRMEGFLEKQTIQFGKESFKTRWCVLGEDSFCIFKKKQDKQPSKIVLLEDFVGFQRIPKTRSFEVGTKKKKYTFFTTEESELEQWEKALSSFGRFRRTRPLNRMQTNVGAMKLRLAGGRSEHITPADRVLAADSIKSISNPSLVGPGLRKALFKGMEVFVKPIEIEPPELIPKILSCCDVANQRFCQLLGYYKTDSGVICTVNEFVKGTSLSESLAASLHLSPKNELNYEVILEILLAISQGMQYLHEEKNLLHKDLKSKNIIIESTCEVSLKITDYGLGLKDHLLSTPGHLPISTACITAPEVYASATHSQKSDVFSFGILAWECFSRDTAFSDCKGSEEIIDNIKNGKRPPVDTLTGDQKKFLESCWAQNPDDRPSFHMLTDQIKRMKSSAFLQPPELSSSLHSSPKSTIDVEGVKEFVGKIFGPNETLDWSQVSEYFKANLQAHPDTIDIIKSSISGELHDVKRKEMEYFFLWFYPIQPERVNDDFTYRNVDGKSASNQSRDEIFTLSYIASFLRSSWFHGFVSAEVAISQLREGSSGCFLVRFSSSEPGSYALSVNDRGTIKHWKIARTHKQYSIKGNRFPDIFSMVHYYKSHVLEGDATTKILLDYPCPKKKMSLVHFLRS
eukprot:TRINITY_DN5610_c0_g1_i1.p1 TRINITY_DN5610_c0_g1~~TRINITY_DN5610_c0_g1_i1.p1  ORF type:complete len:684 (+),score=110.17 TRINITY_DN5610_c0_g1_i1:40-2091(+)